ncbi:IS701 family transposase, partial [Nonomuraea harbinensis]
MVIFNELMARIASRFGRVEPRRAAGAYVRGLLGDIDRKNCWNLAEHAALIGPQTLQRLLRTARWDADAVRDDVRAFAVDRLGPGGVLIVDETGFVKKGARSAGVQRQYSGTAGRIENCQVGVFLEETAFATKPALATAMLLAALEAGVQAAWATGDEVYGQDPRLRAALEARRM